MKILRNIIKWDIHILFKYGIIPIAAIITCLYILLFLFSDTTGWEKAITVLIFSDPVMYGFLFTAIIILFEKDAQTQNALAVTPLSSKQYILSKAIVFTALAFICSFAMLIAANPPIIHALIFIVAVTFSSTLFVFIGIICVSFTKNFNQFILSIPIVLAPAMLPFLSFFNLHNSLIYYLIPTHACLLLFNFSINTINGLDLLYAITYLILWNVLAYKWSVKSYNSRILKTNIK